MKLTLLKTYAIGKVGSELYAPKDDAVYYQIWRTGNWELELNRKIIEQCNKSQEFGKTAYLDIGANFGANALQILNGTSDEIDLILVEPLEINIKCLHLNFDNYYPQRTITIHPFALFDSNGKQTIYTQSNHYGNSSLHQNLSNLGSTEICQTKSSLEFSDSVSKNYSSLIVKIDTQGTESLILSQFSKSFWEKCNLLTIEIEPDANQNVQLIFATLEKLKSFNQFHWDDSKKQITFAEVEKFWLTGIGSKNLICSKIITISRDPLYEQEANI